MKKYNLRSNYESLLARLSIVSGLLVHRDVRLMSDFQIMNLINFRLIRLDAIPMDENELNRELIEN